LASPERSTTFKTAIHLIPRSIARVSPAPPAARKAPLANLVGALIAACHHAAANPYTGAILLTGADSGFCAGSDLAALAALDAVGRGQFEAESGRLARLFATLPLPVLAAVHGFAIGGGLTLAAACDIVVTHPDTRFSLPEVPIGLFPAWGLDAVATRIGLPAARRLAWGIETITGAHAAALGLADQLATDPTAPRSRQHARKLRPPNPRTLGPAN
jgi:enoyl-CoA hydratase/carnithine racemase